MEGGRGRSGDGRDAVRDNRDGGGARERQGTGDGVGGGTAVGHAGGAGGL
jgi:hypothetical protein